MRRVYSSLSFLLVGVVGLAACSPDPASGPPEARADEAGAASRPLLDAVETVQVGVHPGGLTVGSNGEAQYHFPLSFAPGRAGIEPRLSLRYDSRRGGGALGVGWMLDGISSITRCPRIIALHGAVRPVRYDGADPLCLDGQYLISLGAASQHGPGAVEYRPEGDPLTRIISHPTAAGDVDYLEVFKGDGTVARYGDAVATNAEVDAPVGTAVHSWLVSSQRDRHGNSLRYLYSTGVANPTIPDPATPEYLLSEIQYTAWSRSGQEEPARRVVRFNYVDNGAHRHAYARGGRIEQVRELESIDGLVDGAVERSYRLTHSTSAGTGRRLLDSVARCDAPGRCLPAHRFTYTRPAPAYPTVESLQFADERLFTLADMNGDGMFDVASLRFASDVTWFRVRLSRLNAAGGWELAPPVELNTTSFPRGWLDRRYNVAYALQAVDLEGDGRAEVLVQYEPADGEALNLEAVRLNASASSLSSVTLGEPTYRSWGDFDGNGLVDFLAAGTGADAGKLVVHTNAGGLQFLAPTRVMGITWDDLQDVMTPIGGACSSYLRDIDGDGRDEILTHNLSNNLVAVHDVGSAGAARIENVATGRTCAQLFADVNGDGLPDLLNLTSAGVALRPNDGRGLRPAQIASTLGYEAAVATDVNGDGSADVVFKTPSGYGLGSRFVTVPNQTPHFVVESLAGVVPTDITTDVIQAGDLDGDGLADLVFRATEGTAIQVVRHRGGLADLLLHAQSADTQVVTSAVEYAPGARVIDNASCSSVGSAVCTKSGYRPLVVAATHDLGQGTATRTLRYSYANGRRDRLGRGWLGFERVTTTDSLQRSTTETRYDNATSVAVDAATGAGVRYPFVGRAVLVTTETLVGVSGYGDVMYQDKVENNYTCAPGALTRTTLDRMFRARYLSGAAKPLTMLQVRVLARDTLGFPLRIEEDHGGANTTHHEMRYAHATGNWIIGRMRVRTSTAYATAPDVAQVQHTRWTHDLSTGDLIREDRRAGADGLAVDRETTVLEYDSYGNVQFVHQQHAAGVADRRTETFEYDPIEHIHVTRRTNAADHTTEYGPHTPAGLPRRVVDPNGAVTDYAYDGVGRLARVMHPDGAVDERVLAKLSDSTGGYSVHSLDADGQEETHYFGRRGQLTARAHHTIDGTPAIDIVLYDGLGRESGLLRSGATSAVQTVEWDELGRVRTSVDEEGARTLFVYEYGTTYATARTYGTRTRKILAYGETEVIHADGQGQVRMVEDAIGGQTRYEYYPNGTLRRVIDASSNSTVIEADAYGRQTALTEPTLGRSTSFYNGFGELRATVDASGALTELRYDPLGRVRQRTNGTFVDRWIYDFSPAECGATPGLECGRARHSLGALVAVESSSGRTERREFDEVGRLQRSSTMEGGRSYDYDIAYDHAGRVDVVSYPEATDGFRLEVQRLYHAGQLERLVDKQTGLVYWQKNRADGRGRTLEETFGNGVTTTRAFDAVGRVTSLKTQSPHEIIDDLRYDYDFNGNLLGRRDLRQGMTERFDYDQLHRLRQACFVAGVAPLPRPAQVGYTALPGEERATSYMSAEIPPLGLGTAPPPVPDSTTQAANWALLRNGAQLSGAALRVLRAGNVSWGPGETPPGVVSKYNQCTTYSYDAVGNTIDAGDAGRLTYPAVASNGRTLPMAASSLVGTAGPASLTYDGSGRLTQLGSQTFAYDTLGRLDAVQHGAQAVSYTYDAAGARSTKSTSAGHTTYVGPHFRHEESAGCAATQNTYCSLRSTYVYSVAADDGVVAEVRHEQSVLSVVSADVSRYPWRPSGNVGAALDPEQLTVLAANAAAKQRSMVYFHRDSLGSVVSTTAPPDGAGRVALVERNSYNAFGRRRSPDWSAGLTSPSVTPALPGYTGHEDDVESGLVNMGGRVYAPMIGRFLTADPFVQDPLWSQNFARLSYAWNNPLRWVDPTGFQNQSGGDESADEAAEPAQSLSPGEYQTSVSVQGPEPSPEAVSEQDTGHEFAWGYVERALELGFRESTVALPEPLRWVVEHTVETPPTALDVDPDSTILDRMNPLIQAVVSYEKSQDATVSERDRGRHMADSLFAASTIIGAVVGGLAGGAKAAARGFSRIWPAHHAFPKYLGGAADQTLRKIPKSLHYRFHSALDKWKGGRYARSKGASHFEGMNKQGIIDDLRDFYTNAEGGIFKKYLPDFEQAVRESK